MFGKRWRTKEELLYLLKHDIKSSLPVIAVAIWTSIIIMAGVIVSVTWQNDFPNWFAVILGIYVGILVAMWAYFSTKKSQAITESKIRKIEGILVSTFPYEKNNPKTSQFFILYALDGIIETFPEIQQLAKKWKKEKNLENKNFFKEKLEYIWDNAIIEYGKILEDKDLISTKLFTSSQLEELHMISLACKVKPTFDSDQNKVNLHKFHRIVGYCILLIDKLKIDTKFRRDLLKY